MQHRVRLHSGRPSPRRAPTYLHPGAACVPSARILKVTVLVHMWRLRPLPPSALPPPTPLHSTLPPSTLQFDPTTPLPPTDGAWAEFEERIRQTRVLIADLECYVALLSHCGTAANCVQGEAELARAQAGLAEAERLLQAVPAGDEAARQAAQVRL